MSIAAMAVVLAVFVVTVVVGVARRWSGVVLCLLGAIVGLGCGMLSWADWSHDVDAVSRAASQGSVLVKLTSDPAERDYGVVSTGRVELEQGSAEVRIIWPERGDVLSSGHWIEVSGSFIVPDDSEGARWSHQNEFAGTLRAQCIQTAENDTGRICAFRDAAFQRVSALGGDASSLLAGVLIGNKTLYAGTELEQAFRVCGLSHLMAVSGTHLAVVSVLAGWLLGLLPLSRRTRSVILVGLLGAYVVLTGLSPSALRSCAMCATGLASSYAQRRTHALTALWACIIAFLALKPQLAFSLGYLLSVLAMVGLLVFQPLCSAWCLAALGERARKVAEPVSATLAASLLTLPVTIPQFCQLPLISPVSTLLVSPLVTIALGLGVVGLLACGPIQPIGDVLLGGAGAVANLSAWLVRALSKVPGACAPMDLAAIPTGLAVAFAAVIIWCVWPLPRKDDGRLLRRLIPTLTCAFPVIALLLSGLGGVSGCANVAAPILPSGARVVMLDVGQGDAMLIQDGRASVLVDTGEFSDVLLSALARQGISHLDAVILTHKDSDHAGAMPGIAQIVAVDHVYIHADLLDFEGEKDLLEAAELVTGGRGAEGLRPGNRLAVGDFSLTLLAPEKGGQSENADSLVFLLESDVNGDGNADFRGLLTGDAEADALRNVVPRVGQVNFVKVGHHGSAGAFSDAELAVLKPQIALIGVGAGNEYGHPNQQTLNALGRWGAKVYRTDLDGDIVVSFSEAGLRVTTARR